MSAEAATVDTITEKTKLPLKLIGVLIGLTAIGAAAAAVIQFQIGDHEKRITKVETDHAVEHDVLIELRDDVKFMRSEMEHKR